MSDSSLPSEALLEALPDALVVVDADGAIVLVNGEAEELLGRPRAALLGSPANELLPERLRGRGEVIAHAARRQPAGMGLELQAVRGDGTEVPIELSVRPLEVDGAQFTVATVRRAPERTRAERLAVHAREQATVAELGQRALAGEDLGALMQDAAQALADVLGVELVEVLELDSDGQAFLMRGCVGWQHLAVVPVAGTQVGASVERRAPVLVPDTGADPRPEAASLRTEHGVRSSLAVPMLVRGEAVGAVGVHSRRRRDFSVDDVHFAEAVANLVAAAMERRRAATEFETTSARLRAVIDASPAVVYVKDRDGRLLLANRQFELLFGAGPGEVVGRVDAEYLGAEAGAAMRANDIAVMESGEPGEFEERLWLPNGEERVYISLKFPLRDAQGQVYGMGGVSTDVTERTTALEERAALEARLARAERLESVGQLAGGIAHDFNNLLAVIANYAGFLAQAVEPGTQAAEDVEQILVACRGATELTRRLLLFSRRRAGNPEVIDLTTVIAETERLLERALGEQIELRTTIQPDLWRVLADRSQLEQVLMNLAINARDAMPDGGSLHIDAGNVVLGPDTLPGLSGDAVRIEVSDTGTGMPAEVVDRAFEPFFSTKPAGEGTGLGLATVYGVVRGAGGHVDLRSDPGAGTTVVVHLPASRDSAPATAGPEVDAPTRARGEHILLVEDKEAVRVLTARILQDAGYVVSVAPDGQRALEAHADGANGLDVLITDIVMPGLSGQELADELRRERPGLPVVFVSGYTEDYVVEGAREQGATAFVEKPFTAAELLAAVQSVLEDARAGI